MKPDRLATLLYDLGAVKFGEFTLTSGKTSPYYVDMRSVPSSAPAFRSLIGSLADSIEQKLGMDSFEVIASVPTGGLVFASALALETVKPLAYVRKATKDHGTSRSVEGGNMKDQRVLVIDDVITTGGSVIHAIKELQKVGAKVTDALVIVDRMEGATTALDNLGVKLHSLATIVELCDALHKQEKIDKDMVMKIRARTGA